MANNSSASGPYDGAAPDQYAPPVVFTPEQLAALPHDNGGPRLNAAIWTLTAVAGVFLGLRVYCKFKRHSRLWWDDCVLIAAWISITIECALLSVAVSLGYGLHVYDFDFRNMSQLLLVINVAGTFSVTAAIWSKTSFAITLLRLTDGWVRYLLWYIIVSMNIAMGLSALFPWVQCAPVTKSWNPFVPGTCWPPEVLVHYNIFSAAYSAVMDLTLAMIPWTVIWRLQMKKQEKIGVAVAMSMGVFAGITALIKTSKIPVMLSADFADGVDLFIWGNAESTVTIIAASIPILRVLVRDVKNSTRRYYNKTDDSEAAKMSAAKVSSNHKSENSMATVNSGLTTTTITGGPWRSVPSVV